MKSTKTMLVAALAVGALLGGSSALRAQSATNTPPTNVQPGNEHGPGMKGRQNLAKQLNLTDDQKPKVDAIMKGAMEKRKALHEDTSLTQEERTAKGKAVQEEQATQLKAVLTPEQFAKWQQLSKRGPHMHPPGSSLDAPITPKAPVTPPQ
jgi:Spy/CpxP family protein refolding chaperone